MKTNDQSDKPATESAVGCSELLGSDKVMRVVYRDLSENHRRQVEQQLGLPRKASCAVALSPLPTSEKSPLALSVKESPLSQPKHDASEPCQHEVQSDATASLSHILLGLGSTYENVINKEGEPNDRTEPRRASETQSETKPENGVGSSDMLETK